MSSVVIVETATTTVAEITQTPGVVTVDQPTPQVVDVTTPGDTLVVTGGNDLTEVTQSDVVVVVEPPVMHVVEIVAVGPQGPPGTGSDNNLGGYPLALSGAINGDVLGFNGTAWYNRHQETITDGGNF